MRKLWIGAAMAALLVTGCQAGTFHGADGTKIRQSSVKAEQEIPLCLEIA